MKYVLRHGDFLLFALVVELKDMLQIAGSRNLLYVIGVRKLDVLIDFKE